MPLPYNRIWGCAVGGSIDEICPWLFWPDCFDTTAPLSGHIFQCQWKLVTDLSNQVWHVRLVGWLVVFNVPSTVRSFRDGTPIYCHLRRTWSSINTPFWPGFEPRAVAWQSIMLRLRYASSTLTCQTSTPIIIFFRHKFSYWPDFDIRFPHLTLRYSHL